MALLDVKNLSISFGGLKAVDNIHINIELISNFFIFFNTWKTLPCLPHSNGTFRNMKNFS